MPALRRAVNLTRRARARGRLRPDRLRSAIVDVHGEHRCGNLIFNKHQERGRVCDLVNFTGAVQGWPGVPRGAYVWRRLLYV